MVGYVLFRTVLEYGMLWKRVVWGEDGLYRSAEATRQAELCSVYNLPLSEFAKKQLRSLPRQRWDMDYSVGGPLWLEWQRLQTHSEWERWKDLYFNAPAPLAVEEKHYHSTMRFSVYLDWLQENDFLLEEEEVRRIIRWERSKDTLPFPKWQSVHKGSNPEPVEGAS